MELILHLSKGGCHCPTHVLAKREGGLFIAECGATLMPQLSSVVKYDDWHNGLVTCERCHNIHWEKTGETQRPPDAAADMVNWPPHYNSGKIQPVDFILDQRLCFFLGNAVKYIVRANRKGKRQEDLKKAIWYVNKAIEFNCPTCQAVQEEAK